MTVNFTKSGAYIQALSVARTRLRNKLHAFNSGDEVMDFISDNLSDLITDQMIDCWSHSELEGDEQEYQIHMTFISDVEHMFRSMVIDDLAKLNKLLDY